MIRFISILFFISFSDAYAQNIVNEINDLNQLLKKSVTKFEVDINELQVFLNKTQAEKNNETYNTGYEVCGRVTVINNEHSLIEVRNDALFVNLELYDQLLSLLEDEKLSNNKLSKKLSKKELKAAKEKLLGLADSFDNLNKTACFEHTVKSYDALVAVSTLLNVINFQLDEYKESISSLFDNKEDLESTQADVCQSCS